MNRGGPSKSAHSVMFASTASLEMPSEMLSRGEATKVATGAGVHDIWDSSASASGSVADAGKPPTSYELSLLSRTEKKVWANPPKPADWVPPEKRVWRTAGRLRKVKKKSHVFRKRDIGDEATILRSCKLTGADFTVLTSKGSEELQAWGWTWTLRCNRPDLPEPLKVYELKVLFNPHMAGLGTATSTVGDLKRLAAYPETGVGPRPSGGWSHDAPHTSGRTIVSHWEPSAFGVAVAGSSAFASAWRQARERHMNELQAYMKAGVHPHVRRFWKRWEAVPLTDLPFYDTIPLVVRRRLASLPQVSAVTGDFMLLDAYPVNVALFKRWQPGPPSVPVAIKLATEVLRGVAHLHDQGLVQLGLRPAHIHMTATGVCVVGGLHSMRRFEPGRLVVPKFGLGDDLTVASEGPVDTTVLAPELLNRECEVLRASTKPFPMDYSAQSAFMLACFIYELVTNAHPIPCYPNDYRDKLGMVRYDESDVVPLPAPFPAALSDVLKAMLRWRPEARLSIHGALAAVEALLKASRQRVAATIDVAPGPSTYLHRREESSVIPAPEVLPAVARPRTAPATRKPRRPDPRKLRAARLRASQAASTSTVTPSEPTSAVSLTASQFDRDRHDAAMWNPLGEHEFTREPWPLTKTKRGHRRAVLCVAAVGRFVPMPVQGASACYVCTGGADMLVKVWDPADWKLLRTLEGHTRHVVAMACLKRFMLVTVGGRGDGSIRVWDSVAKWAPIRVVFGRDGHPGGVGGVAVVGDMVATVGVGEGAHLKVWGEDWVPMFEAPSSTTAIASLMYMPADEFGADRLVTTPDDRTLAVWSRRSGSSWAHIASVQGAKDVVRCVTAFQGYLVAGGDDCAVRLYDPSAAYRSVTVLVGHTSRVTAAAPASHDLLLSGSGDATVCIWKPFARRGPQLISTLRAHVGGVHAILLVPPGVHDPLKGGRKAREVATVGQDATLRLWRRDFVDGIDRFPFDRD